MSSQTTKEQEGNVDIIKRKTTGTMIVVTCYAANNNNCTSGEEYTSKAAARLWQETNYCK